MKAYIYQADLHCEECTEKIKRKLAGTDKVPHYPSKAEIKARLTTADYPARRYFLQSQLDRLTPDSFDSDDYPKGPYLDGGGESDRPQHCGTCSLFLENPLTLDGYAYIAEQSKQLGGIPTEWADLYQ